MNSTRWEVARCPVAFGIQTDEERLASLLSERWEPFAVTQSNAGYIYHFRRAVP